MRPHARRASSGSSLGGLASEDEELSAHLASRHEVGRALRESGVPVLEFRASVVIGSGSLSFDMVRSLVEGLPVMVMPRWVNVSGAADRDRGPPRIPGGGSGATGRESRVYEIGGAD